MCAVETKVCGAAEEGEGRSRVSYGVEQLGPRASKTKEQPKTPDDVKNVRAVASPPRPSGHVCSAAAGAGSFPDRRDERRQGIVLPSPTHGEVAASLPQGALPLWHPVFPGPALGIVRVPTGRGCPPPGVAGTSRGSFVIPLGMQGAKLENSAPAPHPPTRARVVCETAVTWATTVALRAVKLESRILPGATKSGIIRFCYDVATH